MFFAVCMPQLGLVTCAADRTLSERSREALYCRNGLAVCKEGRKVLGEMQFMASRVSLGRLQAEQSSGTGSH